MQVSHFLVCHFKEKGKVWEGFQNEIFFIFPICLFVFLALQAIVVVFAQPGSGL
jgi:hypothetical protein